MKDLKKLAVLALALGSLNSFAKWVPFDGTADNAMTVIENNQVVHKTMEQLTKGVYNQLPYLSEFVPDTQYKIRIPFKRKNGQWQVQTSDPYLYYNKGNSASIMPRSELKEYFDKPEFKQFFEAIKLQPATGAAAQGASAVGADAKSKELKKLEHYMGDIDLNANPNATLIGGSTTALQLAVETGNVNLVKELLQLDASLEPNSIGITPLHIAALYNLAEIAELLIDAGVDKSIRNKDANKTALEVAQGEQNAVPDIDYSETIRLLSEEEPDF